jgi:hypothetical protein
MTSPVLDTLRSPRSKSSILNLRYYCLLPQLGKVKGCSRSLYGAISKGRTPTGLGMRWRLEDIRRADALQCARRAWKAKQVPQRNRRGFYPKLPYTKSCHTKQNFSGGDYGQMVGLLVDEVICGAMHATAWNFIFPTDVQQKLWWAASMTSIPGFYNFSLIAILLRKGNLHWIFCKLLGFASPSSSTRLFLLVEIFRTLLFLPDCAYVSTWAANVPQFAWYV